MTPIVRLSFRFFHTALHPIERITTPQIIQALKPLDAEP